MRLTVVPLLLVALVARLEAAVPATQEELLDLVIAGKACAPDPNNNMLCTFKVGERLQIIINGVGGTSTLVGFKNSDASGRFYAISQGRCIAVLPGSAHEKSRDKSYAAYISPKTATVYPTFEQCQAEK